MPHEDQQVVRIIDAEANRAAEGLRVIEDYVRFVLDDQHLTRLAKELRHDLAHLLAKISGSERLAARESATDVGATLAPPPESQRSNTSDVAAASFKRVQQALRSIEEYSKLVAAELGPAIEALRFRTYTLERAVGITADSFQRLENARLYVLLDARESEPEFVQIAQSLVEAGVHILQLRDKRLCDRELLTRARRLREITRGSETIFIMNDRPDIAILADADGVHVGQQELSVKDARAIIGLKKLIGVSTHNIEQARQAVLDGANYIGVGPTFPSTTKSFDQFAGSRIRACSGRGDFTARLRHRRHHAGKSCASSNGGDKSCGRKRRGAQRTGCQSGGARMDRAAWQRVNRRCYLLAVSLNACETSCSI